MVCTDCHKSKPSGAIGPNTRTRAEWADYLQADKRAKGEDSLKFFLSKGYCESIASSNMAAAKFADVPEQALFEPMDFIARLAAIVDSRNNDVYAFCTHE